MHVGDSVDELLTFLKRQVEQRKTPINTGLSQIASVRKVLSVLTAEEATNVTKLDVDEVMRRFLARSNHQYSLASQVSYKSRLRSALQQFAKERELQCESREEQVSKSEKSREREPARASQCIQIPLPGGGTVVIDRLPLDLTRAEAERISKIVLAIGT